MQPQLGEDNVEVLVPRATFAMQDPHVMTLVQFWSLARDAGVLRPWGERHILAAFSNLEACEAAELHRPLRPGHLLWAEATLCRGGAEGPDADL